MNFDRLLNLVFKVCWYRGYRKRYALPDDFRFNGYLIRISGDGKITAGKNSYVSFYSYMNVAKDTELNIGDDVSISHNVRIYTSTFDAKQLITQREKITKKANVTIGNNVLIGANVFITPGTVIGDNVVIGANSVVSGVIGSDGVYSGIPARLIKSYENVSN